MEKIKINLKEIQIKDLDETIVPIEDLHTTVGNIIFKQADSIEVNDLARILHKGETVEVNEQEFREIISIIENNRYFKTWVHVQILNYLKSQLPIVNEEGAE